MGMESGSGLSVADALALQDRGTNDGMMGGGSGMWMMMFLFFILAMGGNGFGGLGGNGAQAALTRADLCESFNFNQLENGLRGVQNGICDSTFALNNTMTSGFTGLQNGLCNGFNGVNSNITESRFAAQQCCCETNRNIDAVRYENAKNTCDIITAQNANTQRIIDTMNHNVVQELRDQLQAAQLQLGNAAQTQTLVNELRPCAKPAYITCSPYTTSGMYGCGNGCNG